MNKRTLLLLAAGTVALTLAACSPAEDSRPEPAGQSTADSVQLPAEPEVAENLPSISPESPEPSAPDPERITAPDGTEIPVVSVGEPVRVADAEITIRTVTQETLFPTQYGTVEAGEGTLFLLTSTWKNHSNSASIRMCDGPEMIFVTMYDRQNREIPISYDSSSLVGNDCEARVLTGQEGTWLAAYQGLPDSQPGYVVISDLYGDNIPHEAIVKFDPDMKIDYP